MLKAHLDELFGAYPALQLLTGDALFCQRPLAELIVRPRPALPAGSQGQPTGLAGGGPGRLRRRHGPGGRRRHLREKKGQVVTRRIWVDAAAGAYAARALNFCGLRLLLRVDSEARRAGGVVSAETRYFACSLDPQRVSAAELLQLVRGHWQVENSLHHIKDRWWDEDRQYSKQGRVGEGMAVLRNAAVSILRAVPIFAAEGPIRARADWLGRKIERAIDLLTQSFP